MKDLDLRKVIGFDSWTGGARNFERLVPALRNLGFDLTLVHLGSWGSDRGRPAVETLGSLHVRDISSYGSQDFNDILELEKPAAVLFLSTDTFAHRAFNRYCRQRQVPTLHLYHGVIRVSPFDGGGKAYKVSWSARLKFVSSRLAKALRRIWPTYGRALWRTGAAASEWWRFARDVVAFGMGTYASRRSADDARADRCCVYVAADIDHAMEHYGFEHGAVTAVGNPDLARSGVTAQMIGLRLLDSPDHKRTDVMYIDTGLVAAGYVFASEAAFVRHICETKDALARQGIRLILKPHPAHLDTKVSSVLVEAGIDLCSDGEFIARLLECCAAIVEPSSLALVPSLLGMPVFLAQYGSLNQQRFGSLLTTYPRSRYLTALEEFTSLLEAEERGRDEEGTRQWIESSAGPLPAEDMPRRVAEIVQKMVQERQQG